MLARVAIAIALLVILGVPLGIRIATPQQRTPEGAQRLVIVTPHVPQIRREFGEAFSRWHQREFGEPVIIDWRALGGTSEIIKILAAQYTAAAKDGGFDFADPANPVAKPGTIAFDAMFGGGSFDHNRLKTEVKLSINDPKGTKDDRGQTRQVSVALPMSESAGFSQQQLDAWYGENRIGAELLYDPGQFWLGTALSGFGIVYNRPRFAQLGLPEPRGFDDLTSPRLQGELILTDPRQSGSVTTTIDSILNAQLWDAARREGWEAELDAAFRKERADRTPWERTLPAERMPSVEAAFERGWRTLREITANARAFTAAAPRPPIDVSAGEGAACLAIDFYGRGQAQAVLSPGQDPSTSRVAYVDPQGAAYIDADPLSILRGGPNPVLIRRFAQFVLSDEGQALWNFRSQRSDAGETNPPAVSDPARRLGPEHYELRRLPVRRAFYDPSGPYFSHLIDQIDPFAIASGNRPAGWRAAIPIMVGAFSIDVLDDQRRAWAMLQKARATSGFPADTLARMEEAFYAFPPTPARDASAPLAFTAANFRAIREAWRSGSTPMAELEIQYTTFFRAQYRAVVDLGDAS